MECGDPAPLWSASPTSEPSLRTPLPQKNAKPAKENRAPQRPGSTTHPAILLSPVTQLPFSQGPENHHSSTHPPAPTHRRQFQWCPLPKLIQLLWDSEEGQATDPSSMRRTAKGIYRRMVYQRNLLIFVANHASRSATAVPAAITPRSQAHQVRGIRSGPAPAAASFLA